MKLLRFIMYLFYRYYSKSGTKGNAYFRALCSTSFLIYMHLFQLLMIFNKVSFLSIAENDPRIIKYGKLSIFFIPVFLLVFLLVKPAKLYELKYEEDKVRTGNVILVIYIIANTVFLFFLMFLVSGRI